MANKKELRKKLILIKQDFKLGKGVYNSHGKFYYRTLPQLHEELKPFELKHNVLFETDSELIELAGRVFSVGIATIVDVDTGESITSHSNSEIPKDAPRGMQHSQSSGSSETYALKRALGNLLGVDDSDDADKELKEVVVGNKRDEVIAPENTQTPIGDEGVRNIMSLRGEIVQTLPTSLTVELVNGWYKELETLGGDDQALKMINVKATMQGIRFNETTKKYEKVGN